VRRFRPRAAAPVRGLTVTPRAARSAGSLSITGRLVRPAALRAALRPLRTRATLSSHGPAASFAPQRVGRPVARGALSAGPGGFRMGVPIARVRPGAYRLEVRAGGLRITRRVEIR
jgi:hypothetical protein